MNRGRNGMSPNIKMEPVRRTNVETVEVLERPSSRNEVPPSFGRQPVRRCLNSATFKIVMIAISIGLIVFMIIIAGVLGSIVNSHVSQLDSKVRETSNGVKLLQTKFSKIELALQNSSGRLDDLDMEMASNMINMEIHLNGTWNAIRVFGDELRYPVDGGWSSWNSWSTCSTTVVFGLTQRTRTCDNPSPSSFGSSCIGDSTETMLCPVVGGWTTWTFWSSCSTTCGTGQATRQRFCTNPIPANGGSDCLGSRTEQKPCNVVVICPVNGGWSSWTSWSTCSSTVAGDLSQRTRTCNNPSPTSLGRSCIGDSIQSRPCPGLKSAFTVIDPVAGSRPGTISFPSLITNIGDHYNTSTGIFTCKYPGIYVFALHLMRNRDITPIFCFIRKNEAQLLATLSQPASTNSSNVDTSSNSVVVHLNIEDQVDVGDCENIDNIHGGSNGETSFSGFLLTAD